MNDEQQSAWDEMSESIANDTVSDRYKLDEHIVIVWRLRLLLYIIL